MSYPPRVLFVVGSYPPGPGGAERHTQRLAEALWRNGYRVSVLTTSAGCPPGDSGAAPVSRFPVPFRPPWRDLAFALWTAASLPALRPRYSIVQWVMTGLQVLLGMPVAARLGMKNILMLAGCGEARRLADSSRGRILLRTLHQYVDRVVVLNPEMASEVSSMGFRQSQIVMLPCGADPAIFRPPQQGERKMLRARWNVPQDAGVITFTGRFVEEKRLPDLIEAFARLATRDARAILALVGDGPLRREIEKRVEASGIRSKVCFMGMLPPEQVAEVLRLSDIHALLSQTEGIPCSLVEAVASGLPSVVSEIPGTGVVIEHEVTGLRIPVGDVAGFSAAFEMLLTDAPQRERLGRAARAMFLQRFTMDRVREGYERLYADLVKPGTSI